MPVTLHQNRLENILRYLSEKQLTEEANGAFYDYRISKPDADLEVLFASVGYRTLIADVMHGEISEASETYVQSMLAQAEPEKNPMAFVMRDGLKFLEDALTKSRNAGAGAPRPANAIYLPRLQRDRVLGKLHLDHFEYTAEQAGLSKEAAAPVMYAVRNHDFSRFFDKASEGWITEADIQQFDRVLADARALPGTRVIDHPATRAHPKGEMVHKDIVAEEVQPFVTLLEETRAMLARTVRLAEPVQSRSR